jgi:arylsulfatase A-like enzyme/Flp pilus assembly protein TadD
VRGDRQIAGQRQRLLLIPSFILYAISSGCSPGDESMTQGKIRNVLMISIDTCRADRLGCYGAPGGVTPNIDRLASEGSLFESVVSPAPITLPAHSSMFTGTVPPTHGVRDNLAYRLGAANVTLAERLKESGFATAAVVGAFVLDSRTGIDQGFDYYDDRFEVSLDNVVSAERRGEQVSRRGITWLEEHHRKPFFLFLHYFDPHFGYDAPEPFRSDFASDPYSAEIAYVDHCIGRVTDALTDMGVLESTLIIVTSDHGEMLGEHGESTHTYFIYEAAVRVPLIFRVPGGIPAQRFSEPVGLIDIVPTVVGLLDLPPKAPAQGVDLSAALTSGIAPEPDRSFYLESIVPTNYGANPLLGLVKGNWKYIQTTRPELYDVEADPQEATNLATARTDRAVPMEQALGRMIERSAREPGADSLAEPDNEALQKIRSLGYVGGQVQRAEFSVDPSRDDPKDLIQFHRLSMTAYQLLADENYAEAVELAQRMIAEKPDLATGYTQLASALAASPADALAPLLRAVELDPGDDISRFRLGRIYADLDKPALAIEQYGRSLELNPENIDAHNNLGITLRAEGRVEEAIEHYRRALELDPDHVQAHNNLANALATMDRLDEAIPHYRRAVELAPDSAAAHANLGLALDRLELAEEALEAYRHSLELAPEQPGIRRRVLELQAGSAEN